MTRPDEATPKLARFNLFMGRLFLKMGAYVPGELAMEKIEEVIAERDAALAKVKRCPQCGRDSVASFYEYPSMDTVCPICFYEEQIKLRMKREETLQEQGNKLSASADAYVNHLQQQVADLREALEEITVNASCNARSFHWINFRVRKVLTATKPAETEEV